MFCRRTQCRLTVVKQTNEGFNEIKKINRKLLCSSPPAFVIRGKRC